MIPLPSPSPKPMLNPVTVKPHWALPSALCHAVFTAWQSCPSTAVSRLLGFSRLVITLSPTPLKKFCRQESLVTLCGGLMLASSAAMRELTPLAAACTMVAQAWLPVVLVAA